MMMRHAGANGSLSTAARRDPELPRLRGFVQLKIAADNRPSSLRSGGRLQLNFSR
jgi:hypothetical protein